MKVSRAGPRVTHLLFADDSLMFCRAEEEQIRCIKSILSKYEACSGQKINLYKSSIFLSRNTEESFKNTICGILLGVSVQSHCKYLGLPLVLGRSKKQVFDFIRERTIKKIKSWKSRFLSPAGKEVMIKSVIQALPVYTMSCFRLPKGLVQEILKQIANFWWSSGEKDRNMHWLAWRKLTEPKEQGGLGFKDLEAFNAALLCKQI